MRWLIFAVWMAVSTTAVAQEAPPSWSEVVRQADLIVRARVVEPGRWGARVEAEKTFHGAAPDGPFTVVGFNSPMLPPPGIENESLRAGEVYWLFLNRFAGPREEGEPPSWEASEVGLDPGNTWVTPSPFSGDVPELDGQVRVQVLHGGYPHFGAPMPRERWETLLSAMVERFKNGRPAAATLEPWRACLDAGPSAAPDDPRMESPDVRCLGGLLLMGQDTFDERLLRWVDAPAAQAVGAAAALAARSGDERGEPLIIAAAVHPQIEAAIPLLAQAEADGEAVRGRVATLLAPLLAAARTDARPPRPADLSRIRSEEFRANLLRMLVTLRHPAAVPALRAELPYLNDEPLYMGIEGMETAESGSWVEPVFRMLDSAELGRARSILQHVEVFVTPAAEARLLAYLDRPGVPDELQRLALASLAKVGGTDTVAAVKGRLMPRLAFDGRWPDDRVDMVAAELTTLAALAPASAEEPAWIVARQYLGVPRSWARSVHRQAWNQERLALERAALAVLPEGSEVNIRILSAADGPLESRGERIVLLDGKVSAGNSAVLRRQVAAAVSTDPDRVRLCGPDLRNKVRCIRSRGDFWVPHQRLAAPLVQTLGALAGLGDQAVRRPGPDPVMWLAAAQLAGVFDDTATAHLVEELWRPLSFLPVQDEAPPPLVPPLPPLGPRPPGGGPF